MPSQRLQGRSLESPRWLTRAKCLQSCQTLAGCHQARAAMTGSKTTLTKLKSRKSSKRKCSTPLKTSMWPNLICLFCLVLRDTGARKVCQTRWKNAASSSKVSYSTLSSCIASKGAHSKLCYLTDQNKIILRSASEFFFARKRLSFSASLLPQSFSDYQSRGNRALCLWTQVLSICEFKARQACLLDENVST